MKAVLNSIKPVIQSSVSVKINMNKAEVQELTALLPLGASIDKLGFTPRTHNRLGMEGVDTIAKLVELSASELLGIRTIGPKVLTEIRAKLAAVGYTIAGD